MFDFQAIPHGDVRDLGFIGRPDLARLDLLTNLRRLNPEHAIQPNAIVSVEEFIEIPGGAVGEILALL